MATIAIFCDGTWNRPDQAQPTHVSALFDAAQPDPGQQTLYVPGVGTGHGKARGLRRWLMRVGGGIFGWGLDDNVMQAYRAVAMQYQPGDRLMIFGFSRGAYTARSLAGMIRKVGIIERPTAARVSSAYELYRLRGAENHPDCAHIMEQRVANSPRFATSQAELEWRDARGPNNAALVRIAFLGVWDTVGSLGIPASLLGPIAWIWNRKYRFHDTRLSSLVEAARHAVALDERRVFYRPSLWDNLEQGPQDPGLNRGDRSPARPYQQVWFIGTHAIVGGSADARGLATIPLRWMADGARAAGLCLHPGALDRIADPDPLADSDDLVDVPLLYRLAGSLLDWRKGPGHPVDLHGSVNERIKGRRDYLPLSLRALRPELFGGRPVGVARPPDG